MTEAAFAVRPTVIMWLAELEEGRLGVVSVGKGGEKEAVIVFRGPEEARRFQQQTGRYTSEEGFVLIGVGIEALTAVLEAHGIGYVAVPEPWTGEGMVDLFEADDFIAMLEESPRG